MLLAVGFLKAIKCLLPPWKNGWILGRLVDVLLRFASECNFIAGIIIVIRNH